MPSKTEASKQKEKKQAESREPKKGKAISAKAREKKADGKKAEKKSDKPLKPPTALQLRHEGKAEILSSEVAYEGPLFKVFKEKVREPNGHVTHRVVIRHTGSVVILAVDTKGKKRKDDPLVIMERQYRHAAGQYLWELPAGKIEPGEERLAGAKRELAEETGYAAETWTEMVRYFASPGFLGEWMQVYLAENLTAGTATPEADETLEIYPLPLSEVEELIAAGRILDGKTLIGIGLYRQLRATRDRTNKKKKKTHSKNG
jgi:ADP-ribose pyrophosphatase